MSYKKLQCSIAALCALGPAVATASPFIPDPVLPSDLTVLIEHVGKFNSSVPGGPNSTSPVAIRNKVYGIDQYGFLERANGKGGTKIIFSPDDAPDGLVLNDREALLNVAAGPKNNQVFVAFTSDTLPDFVDPDDPGDFVVRRLPDPLPGEIGFGFPQIPGTKPVEDLYRLKPEDVEQLPEFIGKDVGVKYQVIYEFQLTGNRLKNPNAIAAFEVQSSLTGHHGGGLVATPDGRLLFATGDNLPFGANGRDAPQDENEHVSKLLLIDPDDGSVEIAAKGLRNPQSAQIVTHDGVEYFGFPDIGGVVAEEVNFVPLADILDTSEVENFGWGTDPDLGFGREGTFYVDEGIAGVLGTQPMGVGVAPEPEAGFIQPHAQYGRFDPFQFIAVSGTVVSDVSFSTIASLFGDLNSGEIFATLDALDQSNVPVYAVNLIDEMGMLTSINDIAGGRADPRFFTFGDGGAGVFLENTGDYYRLTEMGPVALLGGLASVAAVPLPAPFLLLGAGVGLLGAFRLRKRG